MMRQNLGGLKAPKRVRAAHIKRKTHKPVFPHKHRLPHHFDHPRFWGNHPHQTLTTQDRQYRVGKYGTNLTQIMQGLLVDTAFLKVDLGSITDLLDDLLENRTL